MISIDGLAVEFSGTTLFSDISFVINEKDRIALMGKNGAGKSTLLKILAGVRQPTRGKVSAPKDCVVAYLPQHLMTEDGRTVFAETAQAFAHLHEMEARIDALNKELAEKGGQAMLEALAQVDPEAAQRLHPNDHKRIIRALEVYRSTGKTITQHNRETRAIPPRYDALTIGLAFQDRQAMWRRIDQRVDEMVAAGLEDEVRRLLTSGISPKCTAMQAIGYKEFTQALSGEMTWQEAADVVKLRSRQYAKRQLTWFGRNPNTRWIRWDDPPDFERGRRASTEYMEEFGIS